MEFKFRAIDERPPLPIYFPPSHTANYFYEQALRVSGSFLAGDLRQNAKPMSRDPMLLREMEKERIREEIIAEEILRRRALEAEVRRELMIEQQMAVRGAVGDGHISLKEKLPMQVP